MKDTQIKVMTIRAMEKRADDMEDEAKALKRVAVAANNASSHVPENKRRGMSVAVRRFRENGTINYELWTGEPENDEVSDGV